MLAWAGPNAAAAEPAQRAALFGTGQGEVRQEAIRAIPLSQFTPAARKKSESVLNNITVFRRMPVRVIDCDPTLYVFSVRHPDVLVNIWQVLGISQMKLRQTEPGKFQMSDGAGTRGVVEMLYQDDDVHVALADGSYEGPLCIKPIRGRVLLLLRSGYVRDEEDRYYVTARLDSFLSLEPGAIELIAKTFQPMMGSIADSNFVQTVSFVGSLSRTAEVNPRGMQRLSTKLENVPPDLRREFAAISDRIHQRAEVAASQAGQQAAEVASRPLRVER